MKLLVRGNKKLNKHVFTFSITPVASCPNCEDCKKTCYALFPYRYYKATKKAWDKNFELAKSGEFKKHIIEQLKKNQEFVRLFVFIHQVTSFLKNILIIGTILSKCSLISNFIPIQKQWKYLIFPKLQNYLILTLSILYVLMAK